VKRAKPGSTRLVLELLESRAVLDGYGVEMEPEPEVELRPEDAGPPAHARQEADDGDGGRAVGRPSAPPGNPGELGPPPRGTPGTPAPRQGRP
jgi:hypothetical protein